MGYLHHHCQPPLATSLSNLVVETWSSKKVWWVVAKGMNIVVVAVHGCEAAVAQKEDGVAQWGWQRRITTPSQVQYYT